MTLTRPLPRLAAKLSPLPALIAAALAFPAAAQTPLSEEAFDRLTRGKTLYYFNNGEAYGVERYMPNRRVIWSFLDGECQEGTWYQDGPQICFEYDTGLGPQCWTFFMEGGQLRAVFEDGTQDASPYVADEAPEEMVCLGPEVGV